MSMPQKLIVDWELRQGEVLGRALAGQLDETFDPTTVDPRGARQVVLDLSRVTHVSSYGVREWVRKIGAMRSTIDGLYFVQVSPRITDQLNMVAGFAGGGVVLSFYGIHLCSACAAETLSLYDAQLDRQVFQSLAAPVRQCRVCGADAQLDDDPAVLFEYVRSADVVSPPAAVLGLLRQPDSKLLEIPGVRLSVRQTVALSVTKFQLAGIIDQSFRGRRLVEAGAPAVTLELEHVRHFDPSGFAHWRAMLADLRQQGTVALAGCPPPLLKQMVDDPSLLANASVTSVSAPLMCPKCHAPRWTTLGIGVTDPGAAGPCPQCKEPVSAFRAPGVLERFRNVLKSGAQNSAVPAPPLPTPVPRPLPPPRTPIAPKAQDRSINLIAGKYEMLCKLGEGGMAEVYLARHHGAMGFRRLVVIKKVREEFLTDDRRIRLFLDEAKLVARIDYPHVIRVYDLDRVDGSLVMVLEFVHGRSLTEVMHSLRPGETGVAPALAATIVADLCRGLARAHQPDSTGRTLVHRDVTPGNVMVSFDGVVKLVDFGLAAWQRSTADKGTLIGAPSWMAPETFLSREATPQTDIWGAGLVLLSILTGKNPFRRGTVEMTANAVVYEKLDRSQLSSRIPRRLYPIIERCLEKEAAKRYADASEIADELTAAAAKLGKANLSAWICGLFADNLRREQEFAKRLGRPSFIDALLAAPSPAVADFYATQTEAKGPS